MDFKEFKTFGCSIEPLRVRLVLQYIGMSVAIADDEPIASTSYELCPYLADRLDVRARALGAGEVERGETLRVGSREGLHH